MVICVRYTRISFKTIWDTAIFSTPSDTRRPIRRGLNSFGGKDTRPTSGVFMSCLAAIPHFRCAEFGLLAGGYHLCSALSGLWLSPLFNGVFGQNSIGVHSNPL